ncbi:hypothetical protein E2C01_097088 [Portunus trituberculatus]|uniref:Uncharacterized protein n=1 Tax=Portunus trituberculatus TaxID=210409 RepID=A0A5B7KA87_PORTR|nr:hypothetical protein [Portunus trituberculatus]
MYARRDTTAHNRFPAWGEARDPCVWHCVCLPAAVCLTCCGNSQSSGNSTFTGEREVGVERGSARPDLHLPWWTQGGTTPPPYRVRPGGGCVIARNLAPLVIGSLHDVMFGSGPRGARRVLPQRGRRRAAGRGWRPGAPARLICLTPGG